MPYFTLVLSFEADNGSETNATVEHGVCGGTMSVVVEDREISSKVVLTVCLVGLLQRELLDHAVDILQLGKLDSIFTVCRVTRWPCVNGQSLLGL